MQGFSAGGEFGTSTALLIEMAPNGKRGFYGSWQMAGQMLALLIGAACGTLITEFFTQEQIAAWPGACRSPSACDCADRHLYPPQHRRNRRLQADEGRGAPGRRARRSAAPEPGEMVRTHTRETLIGVGLVVTATVSIYITFTYLVTYSTQILKLPLNQTFLVQMAGAALMVLLTPFMGAWSDRAGRRPIRDRLADRLPGGAVSACTTGCRTRRRSAGC
nr:MFS transporter [Achromobacter xylosoxidans]